MKKCVWCECKNTIKPIRVPAVAWYTYFYGCIECGIGGPHSHGLDKKEVKKEAKQEFNNFVKGVMLYGKKI